jgi:hypothetical protein
MPDTSHITDAEIETAIEHNANPDHSDIWTVAEVRAVLNELQRDSAQHLQEYFNAHTLVHADESLYVFADNGGHKLGDTLAALDVDRGRDDRSILRSIVRQVYHSVAGRVADHDWSTTDPVIIGRVGPEATTCREEASLSDDAVIRSLVARGCSPAEALDYFLVEECGLPQVQVATERGRSHQTVSKNVNQARAKLQ